MDASIRLTKSFSIMGAYGNFAALTDPHVVQEAPTEPVFIAQFCAKDREAPMELTG